MIKRSAIILSLLLAACGSDTGINTPMPSAPVIQNLKADPDVICVGEGARISFSVQDPDQDSINWQAQLSTTEHGTLNHTSGTDASGTAVELVFKAAKSGRHRHSVEITVTAADSKGLQAEPAIADIFVFNCG